MSTNQSINEKINHHSFQCTVAKYCGSNSLGSSGTSARKSEYSSVVTTFPSVIKITSGDIQPPPSFWYLLNCVSCVCVPPGPPGLIMRTKWRMKVAGPGAHHIDRPPLPGIFAKRREIELQSLQFFHHFCRRQTIDVKTEHHQRVNERPVRINFPILESIDLRIGKKDSVTVLCRREVDTQRTRQRHRLVPGLDLLVAVFVDVRRLLNERRRFVPRLCILGLHRSDELFRSRDFRGKGCRGGGQK